MAKFYGNQHVGMRLVARIIRYIKSTRLYAWLEEKVREVIKYTKKYTVILAAICIVMWLVVGGIEIGKNVTAMKVVYAAKEVIKEVQKDSPIMERIADCESGVRLKNGRAVKGSAKHYDPNTGQVFTKANDNKTVDIGRYMINEYYHGKAAKDMGLDLTKEEDNKKMAYYLYNTQGTEPWVWSKSCWKI